MGTNALKLIASILIAQAAGAVGSIVTIPAVKTWYPRLKKPSFNPPGWLFGPVWTILFTLMGVSLYLIWRTGEEMPGMKPEVKRASTVFGVQLGLNALWSVLFFGLRSPLSGLIEIGFLWVAIAATIIAFLPLSVAAALLLVPYLLWVSFASILNYYIWKLNRE